MDQSFNIQNGQFKKTDLKNKLITQLVQAFTYVDTAPDDDYMKQYGAPNEDPVSKDKEDDVDEDEMKNKPRFMYFIRSGEFTVSIESNFNVGLSANDDDNVETKRLYDGDHFGEIGLIYGLKRTATVRSKNYGSLAKLTWDDLENLEKSFESLSTHFKKYIFKYNDTLRAFLEMEMDKITYFKPLNMITKQELLYSMERNTYDINQVIFKPNQKIDRLIVIQSGVVQLSVPYDKRLRNERFVIERLTSGAVLNHQSFLLEQKAEAEYMCRTQVSCYELSHARFQEILSQRHDLQNACHHLDADVFKKQKSIALDYVLHNNETNFSDLDAYEYNLHKNE